MVSYPCFVQRRFSPHADDEQPVITKPLLTSGSVAYPPRLRLWCIVDLACACHFVGASVIEASVTSKSKMGYDVCTWVQTCARTWLNCWSHITIPICAPVSAHTPRPKSNVSRFGLLVFDRTEASSNEDPPLPTSPCVCVCACTFSLVHLRLWRVYLGITSASENALFQIGFDREPTWNKSSEFDRNFNYGDAVNGKRFLNLKFSCLSILMVSLLTGVAW